MSQSKGAVPPIRLLCLDIDGTLLDSKHCLPPENRKAVRDAAAKGLAVCLLSARPPQAIRPILQQIGLAGIIASFGGALIEEEALRIFDRRLPINTAQAVIRLAEQHGLSLSLYRETEWFVAQTDPWNCAEAEITGLYPTVMPLDTALQAGAPHKLLCMGEREKITAFAKALQNLAPEAELLRSKDEYLEIVPKQADKAQALYTICKHLGIPAAQTLAMGDHDIDCALLRAAGIGVAMGNGSAAAKQAADWIAPDNDHAGAARAIYHCLGEEQSI